MTDPTDGDEEQTREQTQEQRALRHISAIAQGGDVAEHAKDLSDDFTDRFLARIADWFARRRRG